MLVPVFGFGGKRGVSPYVSNNTEVTGYGPAMKESANGWGYNGNDCRGQIRRHHLKERHSKDWRGRVQCPLF